jgi:hypothetical protein
VWADARFRPEGIFAVLADHGVDYVVIGAVAATLHGSPLGTTDTDVCPAKTPENLKRLAGALEELDARIRTLDDPRGVAFPYDGRFLGEVDAWNLMTPFGNFDIAFKPSGTDGYEDLRRGAVNIELEGVNVPVASLLDVIRSKEAAGRQRDRHALPTLRMLLERSERRR